MNELIISEQRFNYTALSIREEEIGKVIVNSAFRVHQALGPCLLEKVYEICLAHEITKSGLIVKRQVDIPIKYD